jgi:hypothetical protein
MFAYPNSPPTLRINFVPPHPRDIISAIESILKENIPPPSLSLSLCISRMFTVRLSDQRPLRDAPTACFWRRLER